MAYFLPSSIQKRLLRYALLQTGFLDTKALDLESLDITLGKRNKIELRNVGLNIEHITSLLQLPSELQIITARVLLLRIVVPADLYHSAIIAEVDGIELELAFDTTGPSGTSGDRKNRGPETMRSPQHRKTSRRLQSPLPYDPGGWHTSSGKGAQVQSTQDLAKSFLLDEPLQEKEDLQATYAAQSQKLGNSTISDSGEDAALGTGTGLGLPDFLANFLQGIVDRIEVRIRNIVVKVEFQLPSRETPHDRNAKGDSVSLVMRVDSVDVDGVAARPETPFATEASGTTSYGSLPRGDPKRDGKRRIALLDLRLDLEGAAGKFEDLSPILVPSSPLSTYPRSPTIDSVSSTRLSFLPADTHNPSHPKSHPGQPEIDSSASVTSLDTATQDSRLEPPNPTASRISQGGDRLTDGDERLSKSLHQYKDLLDIQPGEDNVSWADRRNRLGHRSETSWESSDDQQALSQSILIDDLLADSITREHWTPRNQQSSAILEFEDHSNGGNVSRHISVPSLYEHSHDSKPDSVNPESNGSDRPSISEQYKSDRKAESFRDPYIDNSRDARSDIFSSAIGDNSSEDLSQSRISTLEASQSMYMSAISERPPQSPDLRTMPGHWASINSVEQLDSNSLSKSTETVSAGVEYLMKDPVATPRKKRQQNVPSARAVSPDAPHNLSSASPPSSTPATRCETKPILLIDSIEIWLLSTQEGRSGVEKAHEHDRTAIGHRKVSSTSSDRSQHMPGAFSQYAEQSASVRFESSYMHETTGSLDNSSPRSSIAHTTELDIGHAQLLADLSVLRLLIEVAQASRPTFEKTVDRSSQPKASIPPPPLSRALSIHFESIEISLLKHLDAAPVKPPVSAHRTDPDSSDNILLQCKISDVSARMSMQEASSDISFQIGKFRLMLGRKELVSFSEGANTQLASKGRHTPDISVEVSQSQRTDDNRPITHTTVNTRCLNVDLNLFDIDNALVPFGGLSGVLELSTSMMSSGSSGSRSPIVAPKKGVRFQEQDASSTPLPETKINARIAGLSIRLSGKTSNLDLHSSAIKCVVRGQYVAATVDTIDFTGPHLNDTGSSPPFSVSASNVRLEYLFTPRDSDLERLLSLLTPSKNKYENDDDILLDTLLRQRRKGAVLRLSVGLLQSDVLNWDFTDRLQGLGEEVAKLSAVAKYLPEDDKPGLLILPSITDLRVQLPVNESFGVLEVHCRDIQVAHIGLPALLAVAVGSVRAGQPGAHHLVHNLIQIAAAENLPVFMARMIGDEVEPTCKIKLFNLCLEYSVPIIVALTGLGADAEADKIIDLAASATADLTRAVVDRAISPPNSDSDTSLKPSKKLSIDVLFQNCAVGLQPLKIPAKGLLVLNDTRFTTIVPPSDTFEATLELRKASLHVTDIDQTEEKSPPETRTSLPLVVRLMSSLSDRGFVSVTSIMAARIVIHMTEDVEKQAHYVDAEFRDELFLLEACADSMQTLTQVLGGLSPPTPPSREQKYRTEAMTMEDMMSSFSGDAFERPQPASSTMFDAQVGEPSPLDDEDLLVEAGMSESMYGLGPGLLDPEDDMMLQDEIPGNIAESLLDDDPFEMPDSPTSQRLNDNELLRHLKAQLSPTAGGNAVEIKPYFLTPKQLDRLPGASSVLGAAHRWNTPNVAFPELPDPPTSDSLPFRLRVRNVHVIFNLYDGYDWQRTRDSITNAVEEVEARAEERKMKRRRSTDPNDDEESVIGDFLFNSIYIGIPANRDPQELRRQINRDINDLASETESYATSGQTRPSNVSANQQHRRTKTRRLKLERSKTHKIAFELKGVSADVLVFPPGSREVQNAVDVRIQDLEIFDNVPTSTWRKFLTCQHDKGEMREMGKPMVHIELQNVRPVLQLAATELVIKVSLLPLRAHADQDAVDFMTRFFEFKDEATSTPEPPGEQPFIQRLDIQTIDLCLDYKPKKVDYSGLRSGKTTEFMNFFILDKANIKLKHAIVYGIRGFDALHPTLSDIWTPDVKRNQLPRILSGLAPVSSIVSIGTGFYDVVAVPVREYKKDGRLVRSVQKGAVHFLRNTTSEMARFGASLAIGTQTVLQGAETMLSPPTNTTGDRHRPQRGYSDQGGAGWTDIDTDEEREQRAVSHYADQPLGVLQGLKSARRQLEHDLLTARDAFIAVQGEVLESNGAVGVAQAFARRAPTIILRPVIGASRAVGQTLMGVGNQVDRGNVRRVEDKYKRH